ncbi:MAG: hypothetical protein LBT01_05800, partial [Spirochaetaceae bacterium]|nr:hypothetical protein [Spirochaetaceae bacterium]
MNAGYSQNAEFLTATATATATATGGFSPCERHSQSKPPKQVYCGFYAATGGSSPCERRSQSKPPKQVYCGFYAATGGFMLAFRGRLSRSVA